MRLSVSSLDLNALKLGEGIVKIHAALDLQEWLVD